MHSDLFEPRTGQKVGDTSIDERLASLALDTSNTNLHNEDRSLSIIHANPNESLRGNSHTLSHWKSWKDLAQDNGPETATAYHAYEIAQRKAKQASQAWFEGCNMMHASQMYCDDIPLSEISWWERAYKAHTEVVARLDAIYYELEEIVDKERQTWNEFMILIGTKAPHLRDQVRFAMNRPGLSGAVQLPR